MNGWWRNTPEDAYDWAFSIDLIQHYFPSLDPMHMTLENFWGKLKIVKKMLGQDEKPADNMNPDEFFDEAMAGNIDPSQFGIEVPKQMDEKQKRRIEIESELKRAGIL